MWDMIVLGDIPGTSIKITFITWLYATGILVWISALVWCYRNRGWLASIQAARIVQNEIDNFSQTHDLAHAMADSNAAIA